MKQIVIIGAGSAGTMMASHLNKHLHFPDWKITLVDPDPVHYYQPGFVFLPFDIYSEEDCYKKRKDFVPKGVEYVQQEVDRIIPDENHVLLQNGQILTYNIAIIATGTRIAPEQVDGMNGVLWHQDVFDFYTFEGARNLRNKLREWEGGKLVVHVTEMPIKCPVAPLEFAFLADWYFNMKYMRKKVDITYVTPLDGAFTKPLAAEKLGHMLTQKGIHVEPDFAIAQVDNEAKQIVSWDDRRIDFDLLVTVPTNVGSDIIGRSGLGDDLNFVPTHKYTLQSLSHQNVFVIGDATNLPTSKAGSVAHFEAEQLTENILRYIEGLPLLENFDGHANCFVETGYNKAMLIDFNYETQPLPGTFPFKSIGPMKLLEENRLNHLGKLGFRWVYWNLLMKGHKVPFISPEMQLDGKELLETTN